MKKLLPLLLLALSATVHAQVTISEADMPAPGDTLRFSMASALTTQIDLSDVGENKVWNYSNLTAEAQKVDEYKTAGQVNTIYGFTFPQGSYGHKTTDTLGAGLSGLPLPISLPVTISDIYNFYNKKSNPSRFVTEGYAARIDGLGIPAVYKDADEVYFLPLDYGNYDSSSFYLKLQIPTMGQIVQEGYRKTWVDAWGTITTPYFKTPVNCIRVRSEISEIDSIQISTYPQIGLPRTVVEYKWLVPGEHYPALYVTAMSVLGQEMVTAIKYRDGYNYNSIQKINDRNRVIKCEAYPNPAQDIVTFSIPANETEYLVELFDMQGKLVTSQLNSNTISLRQLPSANYVARITIAESIAYTVFSKQ